MATQPPSKQKRFKGALILSASYSANPGVSGFAELAVVRRKSGIGLWSWCDAYPAERVIVLPASASVVEIAKAVLDDDRLAASAVALDEIDVISDMPPLGELLSLIWCNDESAQQSARLLLGLGLAAIERLATLSNGLCGDAVALMV
jgi:hypothetical protein